MIFVFLLFLFSCAGTYCFFYKHIIDAIEFTHIDYDEFLEISSTKETKETKELPKYEDKYKQELDAMPNEIVVNPQQIDIRFDILLKQSIAEITDKINRELLAYESELTEEETEYKQREYFINDKMEQMKMELWARILVKDDILDLSMEQLIQERIANLKYSYVMEHTPIGNVIMYYNQTKEAFEYYSDNVIPYRYLDTVCRKYVIMNLCVPLYVDISKELKEFQSRTEEEKPMSSVFVKFKKPVSKKPAVKVILKAKTNKYLYQGRMNNFRFMKQTESKSETLSFADYKRMNLLG
jgi:hypothetical protein